MNDKDKELINGSKMKQMNDRIENLLAENKKLREALEKLSLYVSYNGDTWVQETAREALKEIKEN